MQSKLEPTSLAKRTEPNEPELFDRPNPNRTVRLVEQNRTRTLCSGFDSHLYIIPTCHSTVLLKLVILATLLLRISLAGKTTAELASQGPCTTDLPTYGLNVFEGRRAPRLCFSKKTSPSFTFYINRKAMAYLTSG